MKFIKINLATYEYQDKKVSYPLLVCASVLIILLSVYLIQLWVKKGDDILQIENRLMSLDQKQNSRKAPMSEQAIYLPKNEADQIIKDAASLNKLILLDIFPWHAVLDELERRTPAEITILELISTKDLEGIRLTGETPSIDGISHLLQNMEQSRIFKHNNLENFSVSQETPSSTFQDNKLKVRFVIESRLDRQLFL